MLYSLFFRNLALFDSILNGVLVFKLSVVHCCTRATISIQELFRYSYRQISVTIHRRIDISNTALHDIRPSMVTHTRNLCSAINPSKVHTHSSEHTHREHTPGAEGSHFMLRSPGSSWGFGALLKGTSVVVLRVERALDIHSPHLQFLPDLRLQLATFGPRLP